VAVNHNVKGYSELDDKKDIAVFLKEIYFASFSRRLIASLIDGLILAVMIFLPMLIVNNGLPNKISLTYVVYITAFGFLYEALQIYFWGMTIGKRIFKIKVISNLGNNISIRQSILRAIFKSLSGNILCIGYLWMLKSESNQTWHDILSNTLVINIENEDEIIDYLKNNPWRVSKWHRIIKILALALTLLMFTYQNLNKLINDIGTFGINVIYSIQVDESFFYTKLFDADNDNDKEIITMSKKNNGLTMNIYDWRNNKLEKVDSFILEEKETDILSWNIADLDDDNIFEVIVVFRQNSKLKLGIYKKIDEIYTAIKSLDYNKLDIEIIKDKEGRNRLVFYSKGEITICSFIGNGLVKEFSGNLNITGARLIKGDFYGNGFDDLYLVKEKYEKKSVKAIFQRLEFNNGYINQYDVGYIELKSNLNYGNLDFYQPRNFMISDINEDGKDDIVLETEYNLNMHPWLNTFTLKGDKWIKIFSGGYIKGRRYGFCFLGKGDVNDDGVEELVMGENVYRAFRYEEKGEKVNSKLYFYQIQPVEFKLNSIYQRMNSILKRVIPAIE